MVITKLRALWPEAQGFTLSRPKGLKEYTFLHFINEVEILIDGKLIKTEPNACVIYAPNTPQYFKSEKPLIHNWFHADASLFFLLNEYGIKEDFIYYPKNPEFITNAIFTLETEFFGDRNFKDDFLDVEFKRFLIMFSRRVNDNDDEIVMSKDLKQLIKIRQQIFTHLDQNWTIKSMADLVGLSESRFHSRYKSVFSISPINDLIRARITSAENKLLSDNMSVLEIALSVGYSNEYHFIRQFKKFTGMTPGAFRKSHLSQRK